MFRTSIFASLLLCSPAFAAPPPGTDLDSPLHKWFELQHNMNGGLCCSEYDGHILEDDEWRITKDGKYQVLVMNVWYDIEPWQYRNPVGGPNPTGHAIAWWLINDSGVHIYCFTPGFVG
jgi:hypothetical protein